MARIRYVLALASSVFTACGSPGGDSPGGPDAATSPDSSSSGSSDAFVTEEDATPPTPDAAQREAGSPDAGAADARHADARPEDSASPDATAQDAAPRDAAADAAIVDAFTPDASRDGGASAVRALAAGGNFTCALLASGRTMCWGSNADGRLAYSAETPSANSPVPAFLGIGVTGARTLSAGLGHACAVVESGEVRCWGFNAQGQLGNGLTISSGGSGARPVVGLTTGWALVAAGSRHTCAASSSGGVKCWGDGTAYGQLGGTIRYQSLVPVDVVGVGNVTALASGYDHTCALASGGAVMCWGRNTINQLGPGAGSGPVNEVTAVAGASALALGQFHSCALVRGGIKCWGSNQAGALGTSSVSYFSSSAAPVDVTDLTANVTAVAAGREHTCALLAGGTVKCWGSNDDGELGNGTVTNSAIPVEVSGLVNVTALAAGADHTCAVVDGRGVKCWGRNTHGQLGNLSSADSRVPVDVRF